MTDVLILGAGTAGLTAAIYSRRAGLTCTVIEGNAPGGQILNSPIVENYPALPDVSGFDYSMALMQQAEKLGAEIVYQKVSGFEIDDGVKKLITDTEEICGKTLIIAGGAQRRKLHCPGEDSLSGHGVSYCATCDGAFFKDKDVAIIGGGNTALEDALYLSTICKKVYLIHRKASYRAADVLVESVCDKENIERIYESNVVSINGASHVESITINSSVEGEFTIPVSAVFVAIGSVPENSIFEKYIELDSSGYIVSDENCLTKVQGVFVAGDTRTKPLRQLVTAAADGAVAAYQAANYLNVGGF